MRYEDWLRYPSYKIIDDVFHHYCTRCGIELEQNKVGLINFTQMSHIPKGSKERTPCVALIVDSCPHCGKDID